MLLLSFYSHATPASEIYTLSLHDALPICKHRRNAVQLSGQHRCRAFQYSIGPRSLKDHVRHARRPFRRRPPARGNGGPSVGTEFTDGAAGGEIGQRVEPVAPPELHVAGAEAAPIHREAAPV